MLQNLMGGKGMGNIDPAELAKAAGLPDDPNLLAQMFSQVQAMMSAPSEGPVNWQLAHENARRVAASSSDPSVTAPQSREVDEALRLAELWLDPVTDLPATGLIGRAWSRAEWVEETLGTWKRLTEPVANSIANALSTAMTEQMPEEMKSMMGGASSMLQNMGGAIFGMQLGQAIGALSAEVVSSTDIGVPLADLEMALLPANVAKFGEGLSLPENDIRLFLAVREAAHARLFVQVPWLRGHLLGAIEAYARGIHIDTSRIEELARDLDPSNPEGIQEALSQGVFMPQRTPAQEQALEKLETALALVEGLGGRTHRGRHREGAALGRCPPRDRPAPPRHRRPGRTRLLLPGGTGTAAAPPPRGRHAVGLAEGGARHRRPGRHLEAPRSAPHGRGPGRPAGLQRTPQARRSQRHRGGRRPAEAAERRLRRPPSRAARKRPARTGGTAERRRRCRG